MSTVKQNIDKDLIVDVVTEVVARLTGGTGQPVTVPASPAAIAPAVSTTSSSHPAYGVFNNVDAAVKAATAAQKALAEANMSGRSAAIECIRRICREQAEELGRIEFEETHLGRLKHKIEKMHLVSTVPGVEMMRSEARSGDYGLGVTEYAPFGVIGAITPVTHSVPTVACNAIMMIAAGNSVVVNPHPGGTRCAVEATRRWNRAIREAIGIDNLICIIEKPTLETADQIFKHPGIALLCVTGGPGVAKAAMASSKKAIVAGPGNPPVVVDETADIEAAAKGIIAGAAFDNNLLCIAEKEIFVVSEVADALLDAMARHGGYRLTTQQMDKLAEACIKQLPDSGHYATKGEYIGRDAHVIAKAIGLDIPADTEVLYGETSQTNPLVPCEQMMPVLPIVRTKDVEEAMQLAVHYEHGFKHTAIMWSQNVNRLTRMGKLSNTTLFVKNGPCSAGLGVGGEGYPSFSTASPTGEGVTSPLAFARYRRCIMVDSLRIV